MVCGYLENCIMQTIVVHVTITHQLPTLPCWKCGLAMFSSHFILITRLHRVFMVQKRPHSCVVGCQELFFRFFPAVCLFPLMSACSPEAVVKQ